MSELVWSRAGSVDRVPGWYWNRLANRPNQPAWTARLAERCLAGSFEDDEFYEMAGPISEPEELGQPLGSWVNNDGAV